MFDMMVENVEKRGGVGSGEERDMLKIKASSGYNGLEEFSSRKPTAEKGYV